MRGIGHGRAVVQFGFAGGVALCHRVANIIEYLEREVARAWVAVRKREGDLPNTSAARNQRHSANVVVIDQVIADEFVIARNVTDDHAVEPSTRGGLIAGVEGLPGDYHLAARLQRSAAGRD